nr:serine/threonine-protein kinase PRP [Volvox reticuliferus]
MVTLEDEEEEEARIEREREERRRRQQAILQRHAQQQALTETVVAPTATALAAIASGGLDSAAAASGPGGQLPVLRSPSVMRTTLEPPEPLRHVPSASVLTRSAPGTPGGMAAAEGDGEASGGCDGEGDRTPEGERISSSDSSGGLDAGGPVLDIFGQLAVVDDADSGVAAVAAEGVTAEDAELERHRKAAALMQQLHPGKEPGASTDLARVVGRRGAGGGTHGATRRSLGVTGAPAGPVDALAAEMHDVDMVDAGGGGVAGGDDDDMFAELEEEDAGQGVAAARAAPAGGAAQLHDSYDDPEGYYNFQIGEVLDNRYEVTEFKGKGVFSTVMRARDHGVGRGAAAGGPAPPSGAPEVAIKVIRANETMYKAAQTEQAILRKLCSSDPDNRKHCIRLLRAFEFRKHMCLVFEPMDMNLRDLTKKYGRNKGLNVTAVGMYTAQLLVALRHLRKNGVLHADIKPDNILVNARRTKVKLCDFGSAMLAGENDLTPYLVSRFYRAPEVILGMKYDYAMDMWSVGCVVYELFTGNILFPGRTNNEMVKLMMDVKGPFTKKMLRRCLFADKHFDMDETSTPFIYMEEDALTKKPVRRMITVQAAKNNFSQLLAPALRSAKPEDKPQIQLLVDLLEKMMMLEPDKRIDTDMAMRHPFVRSFLPKKHEHGHAHGHLPRSGQREGSVPL